MSLGVDIAFLFVAAVTECIGVDDEQKGTVSFATKSVVKADYFSTFSRWVSVLRYRQDAFLRVLECLGGPWDLIGDSK